MIEKLIKILLSIVLPIWGYEAFINRWNKTQEIMTSNWSLKIFWRVLFFPIILFFSLVIALIKTILLWSIGPHYYNSMKYGFSMFFKDMTSRTERKSFFVAVKRLKLFYELITKGKERRISCGNENSDKIFYVIRPYYFLEKNELNLLPSHLMYNYYRNLHFIAYALNKGWIPIVDWEHYGLLPHQENYPINGTTNGWEYYWNQLSEYTLDEVYRSKNVILSTRNTIDTPFMPPCKYPKPYQKNAEMCAEKCPRYDKLISFNEFTSQYIKNKKEEIFPKNSRILGVSVRGTNYGMHLRPGHPEQPQMSELINYIHKFMRAWNMEYVFIACEAQRVIDAVQEEFGEKTLVLQRMRYLKEPEVNDTPLYVPGQRYQTNLDYVTEMALLSKCTALLASYSGGVRVAIIWNRNQYEHLKII